MKNSDPPLRGPRTPPTAVPSPPKYSAFRQLADATSVTRSSTSRPAGLFHHPASTQSPAHTWTVALVVCATLFFAGGVQAQAPTLERILEGFAQLEGLTAEFHETKRIALLAVPIESDGLIRFAPGRLYREVTAPTRSVALVQGDRLTMSADGRRQEIDLADNPVVGGFVGTFRHVLAGDRAALDRLYHLDFAVEGESWTLTLRPRDAALRRFLSSLRLQGEGRRIVSMVMTERSGDITETTFSAVDADKQWTPAELRNLFEVRP